jgi:hypothetical protein
VGGDSSIYLYVYRIAVYIYTTYIHRRVCIRMVCDSGCDASIPDAGSLPLFSSEIIKLVVCVCMNRIAEYIYRIGTASSAAHARRLSVACAGRIGIAGPCRLPSWSNSRH